MQIRLLEQIEMTAAHALLYPDIKISPVTRSELPALWSKWVRDGVMHGSGIENRELPPAKRLVLVGMHVFVQEQFLEDFRRKPTGHLIARLYDLVNSGHSPLLSRRQIAERNRSDAGLHCMRLHSIMNSYDYDDDDVQRIYSFGKDAFAFSCSGYHYRSFTFNCYSAFSRAYGLQLGLNEVFVDESDPAHPASILQVTRENVKLGSYLSYFFHTPDARFDFTASEQALLARALLNISDLEIAKSLDVSQDTVRKQWRSIFARVARIDPQFFPSDERKTTERGPEKRRHLIHYLRQHLEEIRPHPPRKKPARNKSPGKR